MQTRPSIKQIISKPYVGLILLLTFVTPLVVSNHTDELFEFPKMFFVYGAGILLLALFLSEVVLKPFRLKGPSLVVGLFLAINLVATLFSSHPYTSFWGYYTRFNDGLLSYFVFFGIYLVCLNRLTREGLGLVLKTACVTIIPVGLSGVFQYFGWWSTSADRVYSTFGQPNWLAQYLVMLLPLVLFFALGEFYFFWAAVFVIGFACLWFTFSLSGILGFGVVMVVFLFFLWRKKKLTQQAYVKLAGVVGICVLIAVFNLGLFKSKAQDVFTDLSKKITLIEKVYAQTVSATSNNQVSDPGFIRLGLWEGSLKLATSSFKVFMLGTGPETFPYTFQPFRQESLNYSSEWDYVFNKPHNYYLELLTETGVLGLAVYLAWLFWLGRKLPYYLLPGLAGFVVTNLFGWPVVYTAFLFWVWTAYAEVQV